MEKSHVGLEQQVCIVCGTKFDTGALLLDTRLRERFEKHVVTGWGMCPEHAKLKADGYVAIVGCDASKMPLSCKRVKPEDAYRTGRIAHLREHVFAEVLGQRPPEGGVVFGEDDLIDKLAEMQGGCDDDEDTGVSSAAEEE